MGSVMLQAIGVALKHVENVINFCITCNKSNSAYGMIDDRSYGPQNTNKYNERHLNRLKK